MITISGLTPKQKALLTVMWDIDSMTKVQEFIRTLPEGDQPVALGLMRISIWESLESQGELEHHADSAKDLISRCRSR